MKWILHRILYIRKGSVYMFAIRAAVSTLGQINMDNFQTALGYMGKGMLGIFVVIGVIALTVFFMGQANKKKR